MPGEGRLIDLSKGVARGDEPAFRELYDLVYAPLKRHTLWLARGDEHLADDVLQDTCLRIVRYLKPMATDEATWCWMLRAARTAHIDQLRKRGKHDQTRSLSSMSDPQLLAAQADGDAELGELVDQALLSLSPEERELLEQRHMQEQDVASLAADAGTSVRAMESRLARIRRKVRDRFTWRNER